MQKQQHTKAGVFTGQPLQQIGGIMKKETDASKIAYQNKDITSKVLAERFQGKTFCVYGLDLPEIVKAGPTNIPAITVSELRLDNLFELADQSVAIVDYESRYKKEDKLKYLNYLTGIVNRYRNEKKECPVLRMIVIYTGDVKRSQVSVEYQIGALKMYIEAAFLSELNKDEIFRILEEKVRKGQRLADAELMQFIILPLSYPTKEEKEQKAAEMVGLAEQIRDREQQMFVMAGLLAFADKIIDMATANKIREKISMNKVEWLIRQDERRECEEEQKQVIARLLEEQRRVLEKAEKDYKKEKKRELRQAAKRYEKERQEYKAKQQEYEAKQQEYEAKIQSMIKWIAAKGYAADDILSEFLK